MYKYYYVLLLPLFLFQSLGAQPPGEGERPPSPVMTEVVRRGSFVQPVKLTGTVEAYRESMLPSEEDGVVEEMLAEEGDQFEAGEELLRVRTIPLELEIKRLKAIENSQFQALKELENGTRAEDIEARRGEYEQVKAQLEAAKRDFDRFTRLVEENTASERELEDARERYFRLQAEERTRKAQLELAENGPRLELIERARADYEAAKAQRERAEDRLHRATVRAPYDGVVIQKMVDVGSWVGEGDSVFAFQSSGEVFIRISTPEIYYNKFSQGADIEVTFDAVPGESFTGVIDRIIPRADRESRSFPVKILLPNEEGKLAPGMLGRVQVTPDQEGESLVVSKDALVAQGPTPIVYRVIEGDDGPIAEQVEVETGRYFGKAVEIFGDLKEGDRVVVRGNERLEPGAKVKIDQFITNPESAIVGY